MFHDHKIEWVIIGHSERRAIYKEDDTVVASKVRYAQGKGLHVIACLGETLEERKQDQTLDVCLRQLHAIGARYIEYYSLVFSPRDYCLFSCVPFVLICLSCWGSVSDWSRVVIAYEPVWAIGTGVVATPQQVNLEMLIAVALLRTIVMLPVNFRRKMCILPCVVG